MLRFKAIYLVPGFLVTSLLLAGTAQAGATNITCMSKYGETIIKMSGAGSLMKINNLKELNPDWGCAAGTMQTWGGEQYVYAGICPEYNTKNSQQIVFGKTLKVLDKPELNPLYPRPYELSKMNVEFKYKYENKWVKATEEVVCNLAYHHD